MVELFDFKKFWYSVACQPLWYASIWYTLVMLSPLVNLGARQVSSIILVGHMP
jgi:hypothetical protein